MTQEFAIGDRVRVRDNVPDGLAGDCGVIDSLSIPEGADNYGVLLDMDKWRFPAHFEGFELEAE